MLQIAGVVFAQIVGDEPNQLTGINGLEAVFLRIIRMLLPFGALVLFVMLLYGGVQYIKAGPNPGNVEKAKATITYAIIGTVLLSMAFMILVLIQAVTGARVTQFSFGI